MAWSYETRMAKAIAQLVEKEVLEESTSEVRHRPRFFNKYAFRVSLSPTLDSWFRFDEIKQQLIDALEPFGANVVAHRHTYDFSIYGNDPSILRWFIRNGSSFYMNGIIQTHKDSWNKPLPKANRSGKFFGTFRFRIKMKQAAWGKDQDNIDQLNDLEIEYRIATRKFSNSVNPITPEGTIRDTHIYVDKLAEVLVLKLMLGDQVSEVTERF